MDTEARMDVSLVARVMFDRHNYMYSYPRTIKPFVSNPNNTQMVLLSYF